MTGLRHVLALNIRTRRKELGLTQAQLAEEVDTAPTYIAMIEAQKRFPTPEMLERIALALDFDPPQLFGTDNCNYKSLKQAYEAVFGDIGDLIKQRIEAYTGR
jgi:transcriptional regulator with XRE-family HTH domain